MYLGNRHLKYVVEFSLRFQIRGEFASPREIIQRPTQQDGGRYGSEDRKGGGGGEFTLKWMRKDCFDGPVYTGRIQFS